MNEEYFSWDEDSAISPADQKTETENLRKEVQLLKAMQSNVSIQIKEKALSEWISLYESKIRTLEEQISKMQLKNTATDSSTATEAVAVEQTTGTTTSQTKEEEVYDDWE